MKTRFRPLSGASVLLLLATACAAPPPGPVSRAEHLASPIAALPATAPLPRAVTLSNEAIATAFLRLSFALESGQPLARMTRFEGPVGVALVGRAPPGTDEALDALLGRLRAEAGLEVFRAAPGADARITVNFLPAREIRRLMPGAACFVLPGVAGLADYRATRDRATTDWTRIETRETAAIFIPEGTSPQEARDCLHEELAQALGPLNDLYELSDSVFNDDNFHAVLTGFDMLILRLYNAPELGGALTRAEAAARLPGILARLNPAGAAGVTGGAALPPETPPAWDRRVAEATGPGSEAARMAAARRLLEMAEARGWNDGRLALAHFLVGRIGLGKDRALAERHLLAAGAIYRSLPGATIQEAHVSLHLGLLALAEGAPEVALARARAALPAAMGEPNPALAAMLHLLRAEALAALGRPDEARASRLDSIPWARYGFGSDQALRTREAEIAALAGR